MAVRALRAARMNAGFLLYQLLMALGLVPGFLYLLLFRPREVRERLGGGGSGGGTGLIWVHAASLGEFEAAWPVAREAGWIRRPEDLLISCTNLAARDRLRERLPAGAHARLAPLDIWPCVSHSLARQRPTALIFVETEIWPAWILAAAARRIPIAIVSARISDRSFPRYLRLKGLIRRVLSCVSVIGCRTEEDRRRWIAIGAAEDRCHAWGNTKYDARAAAAPGAPRREGERFILVAGSIRPGEEGILDAVLRMPRESIRLVLVPRHLKTLPRWEIACAGRGLGCRRVSVTGLDPAREREGARAVIRANDTSLPPVLIVDRMGLLQAFYGIADAAFVGGTWAPLGGHNLFEPAREGVPVFFGPSTSGVRDAAEALLTHGGGIQVESAGDLAREIERLAGDETGRQRVGGQARLTAEWLAGGVERTVAGLRAAGFEAGVGP